MKKEGKDWFAELKVFIAECRVKIPIMDRDALSAVEEMQCRIIGGNLISWLEQHRPRLLEERAALISLKG